MCVCVCVCVCVRVCVCVCVYVCVYLGCFFYWPTDFVVVAMNGVFDAVSLSYSLF